MNRDNYNTRQLIIEVKDSMKIYKNTKPSFLEWGIANSKRRNKVKLVANYTHHYLLYSYILIEIKVHFYRITCIFLPLLFSTGKLHVLMMHVYTFFSIQSKYLALQINFTQNEWRGRRRLDACMWLNKHSPTAWAISLALHKKFWHSLSKNFNLTRNKVNKGEQQNETFKHLKLARDEQFAVRAKRGKERLVGIQPYSSLKPRLM